MFVCETLYFSRSQPIIPRLVFIWKHSRDFNQITGFELWRQKGERAKMNYMQKINEEAKKNMSWT